MCVSWSRIGALLVPYLVISEAPIAVIGAVLGVLNIIAAGASCLLPETAGQSLGESRPLLGQEHDRMSDRLSKSSRASSSLIAGVYFSASSKDHSEDGNGLLDSAREPLIS